MTPTMNKNNLDPSKPSCQILFSITKNKSGVCGNPIANKNVPPNNAYNKSGLSGFPFEKVITLPTPDSLNLIIDRQKEMHEYLLTKP